MKLNRLEKALLWVMWAAIISSIGIGMVRDVKIITFLDVYEVIES